jgi:hypothetical protein
VIFGIDHLVLAGTRADHAALSERLSSSGFVPVPGRLRFDEIGAHSESIAFARGAFVEVVYEVRAGAAPRVWFDGALPRVMGIGVASDDFERDTAGWEWTMDEEQVLDDGSTLRIHAAGPHEHLSELYVFAMDRPDRVLDHPGLGGTARLVELWFEGRGCEAWSERLERWLGSGDAVGDVALRYVEGSRPGVTVTPVFAVPDGAGTVALAAGALELITAPAGDPGAGR